MILPKSATSFSLIICERFEVVVHDGAGYCREMMLSASWASELSSMFWLLVGL